MVSLVLGEMKGRTNVKSSDRLRLSVLGVCDTVSNDLLQEILHRSAGCCKRISTLHRQVVEKRGEVPS